MKTDIHPKYFDKGDISCSCGNVIVAGSTREKMKTELCSACHPFYTGKQKLIDTAGRVDKFVAKKKQAQQKQQEAKDRLESKKKRPEAYQEKEVPAEVLARAMGEKEKPGKWGAPLGETLSEEVAKQAAQEVAEEKKPKAAKVKKAAALKPAAKKVSKKK